MILLMSIVYVYDPFCYYRIPENRFIVNNYRFLNAGIAKNADYDTVIIGSSMTQNFNMNSFREKLNLNPVKLSVGAMSIEGMELTYNLVKAVDRADNIFVCIDLPSLNKEKDNLSTYATYLYNETSFDDFKYLLGYETWTRLLPLNIAFNILEKSGKKLPDLYGTYNIDNIGEWHSQSVYDKNIIIENYLNNNSGLSKQNTEGVYEKMTSNTDKIIDIFCSSEKNITFFFPPYSALFWYNSTENGLFENYNKIKEYIVNKVEDMPNVTVYDFQAIPEICDLDNYKDITHYSAQINEYMVDCFASKQYIVTSDTIDKSIDDLKKQVQNFESNNSEWLK